MPPAKVFGPSSANRSGAAGPFPCCAWATSRTAYCRSATPTRAGALTSATLVHDHLDADVVLISPLYEFLVQSVPFPDRRMYQALGVEEVEAVAPVYVSLAKWRNPSSGQQPMVLLIGIDATKPTFTLPALRESAQVLALPDVVLADKAARPDIGPIAEWFHSGEIVSQVNSRRVTVKGLFELGSSLAVNGMFVTSYTNFVAMIPDRPVHMIDLGLVHIARGADPERVRDRLKSVLPGDVRVLTRQEFANVDKDYWLKTSPIGFIFNLGTIMGFIVGAVIVYQILYSGVADHLPEYATLKAIGYSKARLMGVVFRQAVVLAVSGFVPGLLIAELLYEAARRGAFLPIGMTVGRVAGVFALTLLMCCGSAALATRKLRSADPAEIF
jgi:putative ABC transport system permease protein